MSKYVHIISFDVPYPADYGGVIDVFYKIKALNELGVKVILHAFNYGRDKTKELEKICSKVYYYKRPLNPSKLLLSKPFIVTTRNNSLLLDHLKKDKYPIIFEGLHCTFFIDNAELKDRNKIVRTHNVEHDYYKGLSKVEKNLFKKKYFAAEAKKLKKYEAVLKHAQYILAISKADYTYFKKQYSKVLYVPAFHSGHSKVNLNKENYILFHANLSVAENEKALNYLLDKVFSKIEHKVIIAGKNPTKLSWSKIERYGNVELIPNPSSIKMNRLINDAKIHVLTTFQSTGIKLKLIQSLYSGAHCIVNSKIIENTGLKEFCYVVDEPKKYIFTINNLIGKTLNEKDINARYKHLDEEFSNTKNANTIKALLV